MDDPAKIIKHNILDVIFSRVSLPPFIISVRKLVFKKIEPQVIFKEVR